MKPLDQQKILNTMIEFAHDGIILLDPKGIIISVNQAASSILGFKLENGILQQKCKFTDFIKFYDFNDKEIPPAQVPVSRALNGERVIDYKCKGISKETGKVWYGIHSAIPVFDETKKISGVVLSIKDITDSTFEIQKCEKDREHCRSIISYMAEGVVVVDPNDTILEINPAAMKMYGFDNVNKPVKNFSEYRETFNIYDLEGNLLPPDQWALSRALHGEAFSNFEVEIHNKKTGARWIGNYSGTPVKDKEGNFIREILTVQDITARKTAEAVLCQYESYLSTIIEAGEEGILAVDDKGRVIKSNSQFTKLLKIPESTIKKRAKDNDTVLAFASDQLIDPDAFINKARRLYGSTEVDTDVLSLKDGRIFEYYSAPIPQDGTIIGRVCSFRDITGRVKSEKALVESEKMLRLALTVGGYGVYDFDIQANKANVNREYVTMLEYEPSEVQVTLDWWTNSIHPDDRELARSTINDCIYGRIQDYKMEFRMGIKSGGWKWILCQGKIVEYDKQGKPVRMVGTHIDITDRKLAEVALREERNKLTQIAATVPGVIYSFHQKLDGSTHMPYASPSSTTIIGFKPEEVAEDMSPFFALVHPDDIGPVLKSIAESAHTMSNWHKEFRYIHPVKGEVWLEAYSVPQRAADGSVIWHGFGRDITDRKQSEEALRLSEEKFSKAFMVSPDALTITRLSDGIIIEMNNGTMEMSGYTREEMIGHSTLPGDLGIWVNKEDRDHLIAILKAQGEVNGFEALLRRKNGELVNGIYSARIIKMKGDDYILAITRDITEQKRAEEALRLSEEKFSKAFMISPDSITITRLSDGTIVEINNGCTEIFGYTREEMIGRKTLDLNIWVDKESRDRMIAILKANGEVNGFDTLLRRKDGKLINVILSARVIKMEGEDYFLAISRDITVQKKDEEALRLSEEKFSKAFMISPDAIAISRLSDGTFVEVNNGALKIFGFTREELIGHSTLPGDLNIWLKKEERESWRDRLKISGEVDGFEGVFRRKDGTLFNGKLSGRVIKMDGGDYILSINHDITEQKKTEEARNRLTRELRALSSCNELLIRVENEQALLDDICRIICEVAGYQMAWVGLEVNDGSPYIKVVARAGVGESFMIGEKYLLNKKAETPVDIVVRSKKSYIIQDFESLSKESVWKDIAQKNGFSSAIALPLLDDAGNSFGVLSIYSGKPDFFAPVEIKLLEELVSDLAFGIRNLRLRAERKLAQSALVHEKELSDALIEAAPGFFCVLDRNGDILRMNKIMTKLMGRSQNLFKYVYRDDLELAKQGLKQLSDQGHKEDDVRLELKPGEISWWRVSGHAVTIQGTVYIIVVAFDITQRKLIEENLKKALKEKDVLVQELYHRTKNNMQVISSFLAMQSMAVDDEKLQTILSEMENRISVMALVHEKLYKSKDLTNINLREYLNDLADLLFRGFPSTAKRVTLVYEAEEAFVSIDIAIPVGLVVTELLTNSLKYAFPGNRSGKILIRMKNYGRNELELNISDNGIGAPDTFDLEQKNTIGIQTVLSIVRKQLRGSIELDTANGFNWKILFRCDLYGKRV